MTHPVPAAALANHIAILAKTGAGKSYAAQGIAERLLEAGERLCIVDPTGRWWGLRSNAAGDGPGYPVVVFGGDHADVPLGPNHGETIAEIVGTSNTPAILDTRLMTVGERTRLFADFAEALLRKNRGPLHLIVDEAHLFAPQGRVSDPQSGKMLHASNNLISLGRGIGLRVTLISQRPAKLHKDSLTQVETLIVLRLIAPQDRRAVEDWISEWADPRQGRDLIASLPSLKTGSGWVWAPELGVLSKVTFPKIRTYDSGKAPSDHSGEGPVLAPIDLPAIEARLGEAAAEAAANNPKALKARIAGLERELADRKPAEPDRAALDRARRQGRAEACEILTRSLDTIGRSVHEADALMRDLTRPDASPMAARHAEVVLSVSSPAYPATPNRETTSVDLASPEPAAVPSPRPRRATSSPALKDRLGAERKILEAMARRHPARLTEAQWATLSGLKRSGGTWNTYKSRLRAAGLVEQERGLFFLTAAGIKLFDGAMPNPQGWQETVAMWRNAIGSGPARILDELIELYPSGYDRERLAARVGLTANAGTFNTYLSRLRSNGLAVVNGSLVMASEELMG